MPFYLQHTIGGTSNIRSLHDAPLGGDGTAATLRAFANHRFRDNHLLLLQSEYRWNVWGPVDATVFVESGKAVSRRADLDFSGLKTDYGFSLNLVRADRTRRANRFRFWRRRRLACLRQPGRLTAVMTRFVSLVGVLLVSGCALNTSQTLSQREMAELWQEPADLQQRNLLYGPGGRRCFPMPLRATPFWKSTRPDSARATMSAIHRGARGASSSVPNRRPRSSSRACCGPSGTTSLPPTTFRSGPQRERPDDGPVGRALPSEDRRPRRTSVSGPGTTTPSSARVLSRVCSYSW